MKSEHPQLEAEGAAVDRNVHPHLTAKAPARPQSLFEVVAELAHLVAELTATIARLTEAIELPKSAPPAAQLDGRLAIRIDEVAKAIGVSRRVIERERSAGRFPTPDMFIGRMPMYRPETIRGWIDSGGKGVPR
jgi:hypothetical protein